MSTTLDGPVDDDTGNISFNRAEGLNIPIRERDRNTGATLDISGRNRYINIGKGQLIKPLATDPTNPTGRRIILTTEELMVVNPIQPFAYVDGDGIVPVVLWEGLIYERTN